MHKAGLVSPSLSYVQMQSAGTNTKLVSMSVYDLGKRKKCNHCHTTTVAEELLCLVVVCKPARAPVAVLYDTD